MDEVRKELVGADIKTFYRSELPLKPASFPEPVLSKFSVGRKAEDTLCVMDNGIHTGMAAAVMHMAMVMMADKWEKATVNGKLDEGLRLGQTISMTSADLVVALSKQALELSSNLPLL